MRRLLRESKGKDDTLMCESRTIKAHRCIIAARSMLFRGLVSEDWNATDRDGILQLHDMSFDGEW